MNKNKQQWFLIALIYAISNFFLLLNQGIFWDDWLIYNMSYEGINTEWINNGAWYMTPIYFFLQNVTSYPSLVYHTITFVLGFMSTFVFYKILKYYKIEPDHIFILTLFFAANPYYQAKQTMILLGGTIGFFFLLLGILIFLISIRKNIWLRIIALLIILLSFASLTSTIVMWLAFILLHAIIIQNRVEFSFSFLKKIVRQLLSWFDFVLLPFVFWLIRHFFFQPDKWFIAQGHNQITLKHLILAPLNVIIIFFMNTFGLISEAFHPIAESNIFVIGFVILSIFLYYFFNKLKQFHFDIPVKNYLLYIGIYLFIAGAFPYVAVGKIPQFNGFDTRHQILLPIGVSFVLLYSISLSKNIKVEKMVMIILISSFMIANINEQVLYLKSWFKQESLEMHFKTEPFFPVNNNYVVIDMASDYDNERGLSHWALSGILKKAFIQQSRFAISSKDRKEYRPNLKINYYYLVEKGSLILNSKTCLSLLSQYYFDRNKYIHNCKNILECKLLPYDPIINANNENN